MNDIDNNPRLPSICIPRVDMWITSEYIEKIMNEVLLAENSLLKSCIERIDLVGRQNEKGEDYKRVFVHFKPWEIFESFNSKNMRKRLLSGETIKVMHSSPSYWKCSASRVPRPEWQYKDDLIEKETSKNHLIQESNKINNNINKVVENKKKYSATLSNKQKSEYKPKWLGELSDISSLLDSNTENTMINKNLKKKNKKQQQSQIKTNEIYNSEKKEEKVIVESEKI